MATKRFPFGKLILITVGVMVLLAGIYFGGFLYLKSYTQASYDRLNCEESIESSERLTTYYPAGLTQSLVNQDFIAECRAFEAGTSRFAQSEWEPAYTGYRDYLAQYPEGHFAGTAQRDSQKALYEWAMDLYEQGDYETAIAKFDLLLSDTTPLIVEADLQQVRLEAYLEWARALRSAGEYDQAIARVEQIKSLSQNNYPEIESDAQTELAGVYLDWGAVLLDEKSFEAAEKKLSEAMRLDPSPDLPSSPSQQAKTKLVDLYLQWGGALLADGNFERAIEYYRKVGRLTGKQDTALQQAIAKVYVAWAGDHSSKEDFLAALELLKRSTENDKIEGAKDLIEAATQETYTAFSKSSGKQALLAMADAAKTICKGKKTDLPIFGLDPEKKLAFLQSEGDTNVTEPLPDELKATTPGNMHFVVCLAVKMDVKEQTHKTGSVTWIRYLQTPTWELALHKTASGETVKEDVLKGTAPIPSEENVSGKIVFNYWGGAQVKLYYIGAYPQFSALVTWITDNIK